MSKLYTIVCTNEEKDEYLRLSLFGATEKAKYVLDIKLGDFCILQNFDNGEIYGLWVAVSNGQKNLVPQAWKGKYPNQIRVRLISPTLITVSADKRSLTLPFLEFPLTPLDEDIEITLRAVFHVSSNLDVAKLLSTMIPLATLALPLFSSIQNARQRGDSKLSENTSKNQKESIEQARSPEKSLVSRSTNSKVLNVPEIQNLHHIMKSEKLEFSPVGYKEFQLLINDRVSEIVEQVIQDCKNYRNGNEIDEQVIESARSNLRIKRQKSKSEQRNRNLVIGLATLSEVVGGAILGTGVNPINSGTLAIGLIFCLVGIWIFMYLENRQS